MTDRTVAELLARLQESSSEEDAARLYELTYQELRQVARVLTRNAPGGGTLRPTALVHEAYLKLVPNHHDFNSQAHFMAVAARAMRHILVDYARRKAAAKRGGGAQPVTLSGQNLGVGSRPEIDTLRLDRALTELEKKDARMARIAELKAFAGMTVQQVAEALGVSKRTVDSDWAVARIWLAHEMSRD